LGDGVVCGVMEEVVEMGEEEAEEAPDDEEEEDEDEDDEVDAYLARGFGGGGG
jgi:hypothetical protein